MRCRPSRSGRRVANRAGPQEVVRRTWPLCRAGVPAHAPFSVRADTRAAKRNVDRRARARARAHRAVPRFAGVPARSEEHTSELQSPVHLCTLSLHDALPISDRAAASPTGQDRRRSYAERGRYAAQVCRLTRHFPSAQILVLRSETLTDAHGRALEHIAQFLALPAFPPDRKSTRLNSSHPSISALFPYTTLFRSPIGPPRRQPGRTAGGRTPNVAAMPRRCAGSRAIFRPRRYSCCEAKR